MAYFVTHSSGQILPGIAANSGIYTISTTVDGGRNENNDFIGSVVGEDKLKIELNFSMMSNEEFQTLLNMFDRKRGGAFVNTFRVFDPRENAFVNMKMYVGDRSGRPLMVDRNSFRPTAWVDVSANLIQV